MNYFANIDSPVGELLLISDGDSLSGLYLRPKTTDSKFCFDNARIPGSTGVRDDNLPVFKKTAEQLKEYFNSWRTEFDLPLKMEGSDFQKLVWEQLLEIPFGKYCSYGEIACRIGNPAASRAVGLANGRNPISIVVPCHRVIGKDGTLTGYSGGLRSKEFLLKLESEGSLKSPCALAR